MMKKQHRKIENMKKINTKAKALLISLAMCFVVSSAYAADISLTGTFTPTSTLSASVNETTSLAWGNIAPGANGTVALELSNDGSVIIDSTINTTDVASDLTLVAYADCDALDEYALQYDLDDESWDDISTGAAETLKSDLAVEGTQNFNIRVHMNPVGIGGDYSAQDVAVTVSYEANT